ncbi:MAG: calcium-binding protein, partial [Pirellulaceae bacterium]
MDGGNDDDTIVGHNDAEILIGNYGNDKLYGYGGNDTLYGGSDDDYMDGGDGDDYLEAYNGNDTLVGGRGSDRLNGGQGNDGLFGGVGWLDVLEGGSGADRILEFNGEENVVGFENGVDAQIHFRNVAQVTIAAFGEYQTYAAGSWTDTEIIDVDKGLSYLHTKTGNTRLLRYANTDGMSYVRQGSRIVGSSFRRAGGWNNGDGTQAFTDHGIVGVDRTVVHEVAHNWDDPAETPLAATFRTVSDWRTTPALTHTMSQDGKWYWRTSTANTFAREYGTYNPFEDWATTWEAAYARDIGSNLMGLTLNSTKLAVVDAFFAGVA